MLFKLQISAQIGPMHPQSTPVKPSQTRSNPLVSPRLVQVPLYRQRLVGVQHRPRPGGGAAQGQRLVHPLGGAPAGGGRYESLISRGCQSMLRVTTTESNRPVATTDHQQSRTEQPTICYKKNQTQLKSKAPSHDEPLLAELLERRPGRLDDVALVPGAGGAQESAPGARSAAVAGLTRVAWFHQEPAG
jgi:hypothetical protein